MSEKTNTYRIPKMFFDLHAIVFIILPLALLIPVFIPHGQFIVSVFIILLSCFSLLTIIDIYRPTIVITNDKVSYSGFLDKYTITSEKMTDIFIGTVCRLEGSYIQIKGTDTKEKRRSIQFRNPLDQIGVGQTESLKYQNANSVIDIINKWRTSIDEYALQQSIQQPNI